ncbi:MAG TPA: DNA repair protein RecO [Xanthobacteraceae bacterium]|jgi:DNA repair protein RecO (recombination protein O)|nr:DNA repair protein RecO [Xanthobacteraceae bacterium]
MEWIDQGFVLGVRRHGEANAILEVMTCDHGRHLGLVRGGGGSRLRPILQPGNTVQVSWRARLDEHLGNYTVEGLDLRAASFLSHAHAVYGITHLAALCRLLPERDPHPVIHRALAVILDRMDDRAVLGASVARFELLILAELGFGLDLQQCASTGAMTDLVYVSPKSGRAVSREAGKPWQDRLLRLPSFLSDAEMAQMPSLHELADGYTLTGFFLTRYVMEPRGGSLSDARDSFIAALVRDAPGGSIRAAE